MDIEEKLRVYADEHPTCGYPEWKHDDDMYPDWDHADECSNEATVAIIRISTGNAWSFRCQQHRSMMERNQDINDISFMTTRDLPV